MASDKALNILNPHTGTHFMSNNQLGLPGSVSNLKWHPRRNVLAFGLNEQQFKEVYKGDSNSSSGGGAGTGAGGDRGGRDGGRERDRYGGASSREPAGAREYTLDNAVLQILKIPE